MNNSAMDKPNSKDPQRIKGRRLPCLFFVRSDHIPIIGSVTASHKTAIVETAPATAGEMPAIVVMKKMKNAKSSYNTDDGIFKLAPEGQFVYGAATGYFDCYKNDVSGEEHYKCHFILN